MNRGHACVKGRFAHAFARAGDRLTSPLVRRGGRLQPATWDEALDLVGRTATHPHRARTGLSGRHLLGPSDE